jgi:hypothetical protein
VPRHVGTDRRLQAPSVVACQVSRDADVTLPEELAYSCCRVVRVLAARGASNAVGRCCALLRAQRLWAPAAAPSI